MKRIVISLLLCMVMLIGVLVVSALIPPKEVVSFPVIPETKTSVSKEDMPQISMSEQSREEYNIVQSMVSMADVELYNDLGSLVADSEIVAIGTVKEIDPFCNENGLINSNVVLEIEYQIKGKVEDDVLTYRVSGGRMPILEWYAHEANAARIKGKESLETYEKAMDEAAPNDMAELLFMNVKNPEVGDRVLVFLVFNFVDHKDYVMKVAPCNGLFYYDAKTDTYYKTNDLGTMRTDLSELEMLSETTPDNSAKLREEAEEKHRRHLEALENPPPDEGVHWDEIEPREPNPAYGKNGE